MQYSEFELKQIHNILYEILGEFIRVCEQLEIPYFMIGGSALGCHFFNGMIPWDDDIDIGMTRENYNRFLREAPAILSQDYFLQWTGSDPHTPFSFAKIRKNNTAFVEKQLAHISMHHGLFIDVFPFDKVPDNEWLRDKHRKLVNIVYNWHISKEMWIWKYFKKCEIEEPARQGWLSCVVTLLASNLLSKRAIYMILCKVMGMFNNSKRKYYNITFTTVDLISKESVENLVEMQFGPHTVLAPSDLETYLRHHYKNLRKWIPKEEQITHMPYFLSFDKEWDYIKGQQK